MDATTNRIQAIAVNMRMPVPLAEAVDDWRCAQPSVISRSEAIRALVEKGLATQPRLPKRVRVNGS